MYSLSPKLTRSYFECRHLFYLVFISTDITMYTRYLTQKDTHYIYSYKCVYVCDIYIYI